MIKKREKSTNKSVYLLKKHWRILNRYARKNKCPLNWAIKCIVEDWIIKNQKELNTKSGGGRI